MRQLKVVSYTTWTFMPFISDLCQSNPVFCYCYDAFQVLGASHIEEAEDAVQVQLRCSSDWSGVPFMHFLWKSSEAALRLFLHLTLFLSMIWLTYDAFLILQGCQVLFDNASDACIERKYAVSARRRSAGKVLESWKSRAETDRRCDSPFRVLVDKVNIFKYRKEHEIKIK